ncbi:hypothetical protein SCHPADRAFT_948183 [Schizopora paradoxa]|uniref:Uncharacterized protein n=1 Tax=Schizopora paradoxa TaxID=27342 RepID=A0A0H2R3A9_9AGAM|nr:hypothetical protein SCHPADRAFT_948183 [Schizopora paradoxa]
MAEIPLVRCAITVMKVPPEKRLIALRSTLVLPQASIWVEDLNTQLELLHLPPFGQCEFVSIFPGAFPGENVSDESLGQVQRKLDEGESDVVVYGEKFGQQFASSPSLDEGIDNLQPVVTGALVGAWQNATHSDMIPLNQGEIRPGRIASRVQWSVNKLEAGKNLVRSLQQNPIAAAICAHWRSGLEDFRNVMIQLGDFPSQNRKEVIAAYLSTTHRLTYSAQRPTQQSTSASTTSPDRSSDSRGHHLQSAQASASIPMQAPSETLPYLQSSPRAHAQRASAGRTNDGMTEGPLAPDFLQSGFSLKDENDKYQLYIPSDNQATPTSSAPVAPSSGPPHHNTSHVDTPTHTTRQADQGNFKTFNTYEEFRSFFFDAGPRARTLLVLAAMGSSRKAILAKRSSKRWEALLNEEYLVWLFDTSNDLVEIGTVSTHHTTWETLRSAIEGLDASFLQRQYLLMNLEVLEEQGPAI